MEVYKYKIFVKNINKLWKRKFLINLWKNHHRSLKSNKILITSFKNNNLTWQMNYIKRALMFRLINFCQIQDQINHCLQIPLNILELNTKNLKVYLSFTNMEVLHLQLGIVLLKEETIFKIQLFKQFKTKFKFMIALKNQLNVELLIS
jgi:hypothetical protein